MAAMKRAVSISLVIAAIAAVAAAGWYRLAADGRSVPTSLSSGNSASVPAERSSPSVVLSINPSKSSPLARGRVGPEALTLAQEHRRARHLKALYERLASPGGSNTPESKYVLYQILGECAARPDLGRSASDRRKNIDDMRASIEALPETNPDKARRLQAYMQLTGGRCEGLEGLSVTKDQLEQLLQEAERGGDPKARAQLLAREIYGSMRANATNSERLSPAISDAQVTRMQEIFRSRDPDAIIVAGNVLSNTFRDVVIEVGPNRLELNHVASRDAWRMVACDYGHDCGPGSRSLLAACAHQSHCDVSTVPDLILFYGASPHQAQVMENYRQIFRNAIETNDWSQIHFSRRRNDSPLSRHLFMGGSGP
jgi:hypothetical protein